MPACRLEPSSSTKAAMPPVPTSLSSNLLSADGRRAFYEQHRAVAMVMIGVVLVAPFAGLYVAGLIGAAIAVGCSVLVYSLTPLLWHWFGG